MASLKERVILTKLLRDLADYRITILSELDHYEPTTIEITQIELNELVEKCEKYRGKWIDYT